MNETVLRVEKPDGCWNEEWMQQLDELMRVAAAQREDGWTWLGFLSVVRVMHGICSASFTGNHMSQFLLCWCRISDIFQIMCFLLVLAHCLISNIPA